MFLSPGFRILIAKIAFLKILSQVKLSKETYVQIDYHFLNRNPNPESALLKKLDPAPGSTSSQRGSEVLILTVPTVCI